MVLDVFQMCKIPPHSLLIMSTVSVPIAYSFILTVHLRVSEVPTCVIRDPEYSPRIENHIIVVEQGSFLYIILFTLFANRQKCVTVYMYCAIKCHLAHRCARKYIERLKVTS